MYLKNLTVLGFKSFADKTSLNFQPGVTAIVGPNGCGKSNVSDAIRWVLGEQSAKALRGGEMADVIFNGTDGRKPLSMAEVSLTLGGVDAEHLQAAGVEVAYNEVTLTRRVFRDGGSEYFINKTPCRLKDIQQLFMGTGVGRTSYSIMAQGNITQILSSKPEDRRLIFEEAAGITKFKAQKKEAMRKLEYTEQNLLRVQDLIKEVKRQIGSLQRQAGKARRYKQIMGELQHLDTQLARHQLDILISDIRERNDKMESLREQVEQLSQSVLTGESEIAHLRERLSELEQEISQAQQQGLQLKSEADKHESRIHFNEQRLRELEQQNAQATSEISQAEERKLAAEQELTSVTERLAASTEQLKQLQATLEERRQALVAVETEARAKQDALRKATSDAQQAAYQLSRIRNEITALDLQKEGNVVRLQKLSSEKVQLEQERVGLEDRLKEFSANFEAEMLNAQTHRGTVQEREARLKQIDQELNAANRQLQDLLRLQAEKRSRLNVLEQLQNDHEGFSSGALSALRNAQQVLGSLADKIRVPNDYVVAIESTLGHHLQLVLTQAPESAQQIIDDLRTNKKGKASIAALDLVSQVSKPAVSPVSKPADLQDAVAALEVIECDEAIRPMLQSLLGCTLIVSDIAAAIAAFRQTNGAYNFVTRTGDLLNSSGIFTGGAGGNDKASASILGRKNQIAELQAAADQIQEQVNEASKAKGALLSEQTQLQASLQEAKTELHSQEVAIATRKGEFNALQNSQRVLEQKVHTVVYEITRLAAQEEEGLKKRQGLADQVGALEEQERTAQEAVQNLNTGLEGLRQQRDAATAAMTETKVAYATEEQLLASLRNQQKPLESRIRELAHMADQRRNEIRAFIDRKAQAEGENIQSRHAIEALQQQREQVSNQVADLITQKDTQEEQIATAEEALRDQRRCLTEYQQQRGSIEVELAQKNMAAQNLRDRMQEKYQINLDQVRSECITITIADEGAPRINTMTPEEMAAAGAATDWEAVAKQVAELQRKLDEMGPVNLVAIDEYEETEQRYQFLTKQHDDLVQAKAQLSEVINRINTQTREMFVETFEKIRTNFRTMFTEIFNGGKADLVLEQDGDVLESGINIMARPPGKQLQTISLLSGGEQTMTAVALLFSIYQVKPSPFCVLDELDAPLDEANVGRFIKVLQRFLTHSQFVIITHNKRTIAMADVLYGVTMQEHGVSKIVGVKFHKADAQTPPPEAPKQVEAAPKPEELTDRKLEPHEMPGAAATDEKASIGPSDSPQEVMAK